MNTKRRIKHVQKEDNEEKEATGGKDKQKSEKGFMQKRMRKGKGNKEKLMP